MLLTKAEPGIFDEKDKSKPVYILGTSPDLATLPLTFWQQNDIIGMNSTCEVPFAKGNMDHWICADAVMPWSNWIKHDKDVHKWVYYKYRVDPRLGPRIFNSILYKWTDPPLRRDWREGLVTFSFTLSAALSLAYALGYKDVRLRGIRFGIDTGEQVHWKSPHEYFGSQIQRNAMEALYGEQLRVVREFFVPEYRRLGLTLVNETPGAPNLEGD